MWRSICSSGGPVSATGNRPLAAEAVRLRIRINADTQRISLGMKQLESDPWEASPPSTQWARRSRHRHQHYRIRLLRGADQEERASRQDRLDLAEIGSHGARGGCRQAPRQPRPQAGPAQWPPTKLRMADRRFPCAAIAHLFPGARTRPCWRSKTPRRRAAEDRDLRIVLQRGGAVRSSIWARVQTGRVSSGGRARHAAPGVRLGQAATCERAGTPERTRACHCRATRRARLAAIGTPSVRGPPAC